MRLICFGDSICQGYGAQPGKGWVTQLSWSLAALPNPITVLNAGRNGDTTFDALHRMFHDVEQRHPEVVYLQFGLNDTSIWGHDESAPQVDAESYLANIQEMINRAKACGAKTVFLATNHPVGAHSLFVTDAYRDTVAEYNALLRSVFFGMRGIQTIDMEREILLHCSDPESLLLSDGIHLSPAGNRFYCDTVSRHILQWRAGQP